MLCTSAVAAIDFMLSECCIQFKKYSSTATIITLQYKKEQFEDFLGCRLWHRKFTLANYPENPTYMVLYPLRRFVLSNLDPLTECFCKVHGKLIGRHKHWRTNNNHEKLIVHCMNTASVPPIALCKLDRDLEIPSLMPKKHLTQKDYDYCVDVIRLLNNEGHIENDFKVRFFSWFSLRVVK
ncbi:hypothetical protein NE237_020523 [Protea cynaroides]|uniref:Uncharacterized protein n=1 Tax=Protea cynaroides TaxID=273540 RepID=A0A9Q0H6T4_9MAGN|nr:hypothetical protein NE237_020523 [Protea cynaroides]